MFEIYKPSQKGTGSAFRLDYDGSAFGFSIIKQASVQNEKKGTFSGNRTNPEKNIYVKISLFEAGSIIQCLNGYQPFNVQHNNVNKNATIFIKFEPYFKANLVGEQEHVGYSLAINQSPKTGSTAPKTSFIIGFGFGEAEVLKQALIAGIQDACLRKIKTKKNNNTVHIENIEIPTVIRDNSTEQPFS